MADRERLLRATATNVLMLHKEGKDAEALEYATVISGFNPPSALALNLLGYLHVCAANWAWEKLRASGGDEAASVSMALHRRAAVKAYADAARIAPNCVRTGGRHAKALANAQRYADGMRELHRVLSVSRQDDPQVHDVQYDFMDDSGARERKREAVNKARILREKLTAKIVCTQAAKLFRADAALGPLQLQERAQLISKTFPASSRAQLLRVYIELEQGRAVDEPMRRKMILLRVLDLTADSAATFDSSLLIAFVHAKVLFALDRFDESETECRRALSIQGPIDPSLDDVPPAVSVPGADYDARVLSLRTEIRVLHRQIVMVAAQWWNSIQTTQHSDRVDRVISLRVDKLHLHYDGFDKPAAKTIAEAVHFHRSLNSWSFFICPSSSCNGKKFVDTDALWEHIRKQHRKDEPWKKLQSVLGRVHIETASKDDDDSLDGITLTQDSEHNDIFILPRVQDMFESLIRSPTIGIQAEPLVEIRRRKCREGAEILEDIKKKLSMLPKDKLSTAAEFQEFCSAIKNMWLKVLETSAMDHREVILPLARSFQWIEMKRSIALSAKDLRGIIGAANIDAVFGNAPGAPDHQSGDNLEPEKLKPSGADATVKAAETCEESDVSVQQRVSSHEVMRVDMRVERTMQLIRHCLQRLQYVRNDGTMSFDLGVRLSNAGANLMLLHNRVNAGLEYVNQVNTFLEMYGLRDVLGLARQLIDGMNSTAQLMGTANNVLIIGSRVFSSVGRRLQERHPSSQTGGRNIRQIREVVKMRSVEEAHTIIDKWERCDDLVEADVDEEISTDEARAMHRIFIDRHAYDLIRDSSVLLSKVQSSDDPDWVIA